MTIASPRYSCPRAGAPCERTSACWPQSRRAPGSGAVTGRGAQELKGTPFERVLQESVTEVVVEPASEGATRVTIGQRHKLKGSSRLGVLHDAPGNRQTP